MREKLCGIYKITNLESGKVYVGSSINMLNRFTQHKGFLKRNDHKNAHLQKAWNLYGERSFIFQILETVENVDVLLSRESFWINELKCVDRIYGYNKHTIDPDTGRNIFSDETRKKLSISNTGKKLTAEARKKIGEANKRRPPCSEETRKKLSISSKLWHLGKTHTEESKHKMSLAKLGRVSNRKGAVLTEETKRKFFAATAKTYSVINPNGELITFKGLNKFCRENFLDAGTLSKVAKGLKNSYKGYKPVNL